MNFCFGAVYVTSNLTEPSPHDDLLCLGGIKKKLKSVRKTMNVGIQLEKRSVETMPLIMLAGTVIEECPSACIIYRTCIGTDCLWYFFPY